MALNITCGKVWKAQKVVVYGPEGIGKSTFAAQFPDPLFIDTEGSTNLMDVARLPRPTSWTMMLALIKEVKSTPGCCKTLVIDTMDWAEQLCVNHICAIYDKKGIEDFGYGKGYVCVKEEIGRFLNLLQDVIDVGINVVLTAHTSIRKFELPDECGSFDRYELKLGNKTGGQTSALVKEWADIVLFANYKQHVVEIEKKKKAQGGNRVMHTTHHPCWDAKNRHDLKPELPFDYIQISYCIPNHDDEAPPASEVKKETQPAADPPKQEIPQQTTVNFTGEKCSVCGEPQFNTTSGVSCAKGHGGAPPIKINIADKDMYFYHPESESYWGIKKGEALPTGADFELSVELDKAEWEKRKKKHDADLKQSEKKPEKQSPPYDLQGLPKPLADLMEANSVTVEEIQRVVSGKGYYPKDTPIKNYDPGFIDGVLVGAWEQVFNMIQMERAIPF